MTPARNTIGKLCLAAAAVLLLAGCAYFNTFYNARQYYKEGLRYKEQNQLGQAKGKFDKAIEKSAVVLSRWPRSRWADDALYLIAMSYFHEALYPKALRHLNQFVLAFPESPLVPDAELHRGLALQKDREYGQAWAVLDAVRQRYPRLAGDAAYYLAQPAFDREEYAPAVDSLAAFVARYPRSRFVKPAMLQLAQACFRTGRWADAEGWYGKYERIETDARKRAAARLEMAACRYEKGDFQGAVAEVREIIGRYQEYDDEANLLLGQALSRMERYSEAISAWSNLRGATAQGAEAAFLIGKHHEEAESFERARAYYDTARSRRADSDHGVLAVKRLSLLDAFAQRDSSTTDTAEAEFLLAEVYNLNLGDFDRAAERYQRVYDSFPQSEWAPKALFAKAWIVRNVRHDTAAAEPMLRKVIAEYPDTEYADEARRWLGLPVPRRAARVAPPRDTLASMPPPDTIPGAADTVLPGEMARVEEPAGMRRGRDRFEPGFVPGQAPPGATSGPLPPEPGLQGEPPPEAPGQAPPLQPLEPRPPEPARARLPEPGLSREPPRPDEPPPPPPEPTEARRETPVIDPATGQVQQVAELPAAAPAETAAAETGPLASAHFETDSWRILPADTGRLRAAAAALREMTGRVVLEGHCDPRGTEAHNYALGLRRAEVVRDWLVRAGVSAERLLVQSRGESGLLSSRPEEYWKDRRVEFRTE